MFNCARNVIELIINLIKKINIVLFDNAFLNLIKFINVNLVIVNILFEYFIYI